MDGEAHCICILPCLEWVGPFFVPIKGALPCPSPCYFFFFFIFKPIKNLLSFLLSLPSFLLSFLPLFFSFFFFILFIFLPLYPLISFYFPLP
ncbi:hypothetical protein BDF14DRAFT_206095 [Spinellus fusiger]|nr:hypothetical protein BDF14DRAFT_206095 [Spinellus fusiger]